MNKLKEIKNRELESVEDLRVLIPGKDWIRYNDNSALYWGINNNGLEVVTERISYGLYQKEFAFIKDLTIRNRGVVVRVPTTKSILSKTEYDKGVKI